MNNLPTIFTLKTPEKLAKDSNILLYRSKVRQVSVKYSQVEKENFIIGVIIIN